MLFITLQEEKNAMFYNVKELLLIKLLFPRERSIARRSVTEWI